MKRNHLAVLAGVLVGSVALAAASQFSTPAHFLAGAKFASRALLTGAPALTRVLTATKSAHDFASQTITCNTTTVTVTGARTTDFCVMGLATGGGAANSSFTCYVSASDTVTIKHCPAGTASDPASQDFQVMVFSTQAG